MNSKPHRDEWFPPEPPEEDIRLLAFQLWLKDGQVHGSDLEHWFTARQLLLHEAKQHHEIFHTRTTALPAGSLRSDDLPGRPRTQRARAGVTGAAQRVRARHQPRRTRTAFQPHT